MGSSISTAMEESMKKNSIDMMIQQRDLQLKMREVQLATQFSIGKDRFHFFSAFYLTVIFGGVTKFIKTGNPNLMIPIVPLSFAWLYQFDMYYLNKMKRVREEAGRILKENNDMFTPPLNNHLIDPKEYEKKFINK